MGTPPAGFDFSLNPSAGITIHHIGSNAEPVVVIDRVMRVSGALVDYAATQVSFAPCAPGGYPGVRAAAPLSYVEHIVRQLDPLIRHNFDVGGGALAHAECNFSIVTTAPVDLRPVQRIPHIDTSYPLQFALLHYLCDGNFGGTGFFRQDATSIEIVGPDNEARYVGTRDRELMVPPPPGYVSQNCRDYTSTGAFEAIFDRLLLYRSCHLHCGLIPADMPREADPLRGRLTANIFVTYTNKKGA